MQSFIATMVIVIQLALAGFVVWGGWLVVRDFFRSRHAQAPAANPAQASAQAQADDFERVASLVLLALLCSTIMAAA